MPQLNFLNTSVVNTYRVVKRTSIQFLLSLVVTFGEVHPFLSEYYLINLIQEFQSSPMPRGGAPFQSYQKRIRFKITKCNTGFSNPSGKASFLNKIIFDCGCGENIFSQTFIERSLFLLRFGHLGALFFFHIFGCSFSLARNK